MLCILKKCLDIFEFYQADDWYDGEDGGIRALCILSQPRSSQLFSEINEIQQMPD